MGKNPAAVALGRKGGLAAASKLTPSERKEKMRKVAQARWAAARARTQKAKARQLKESKA